MKIQLTTPSRGSLDHEFLRSCDELIALARVPNAQFRLSLTRAFGGSLLDHSRSRLATDFLATDSDILCWVDDDMVFDAEQLVEMCKEAYEIEAIVGAAATTKKKRGLLTTQFRGRDSVEFFENGSLIPVNAIGCGMTAVHRKVFEALAQTKEMLGVRDGQGDHVYPFYMTLIDDDGLWWGEDTSFCVRASKLGFSTFCDTRVRVGHKGSYVYHLEDIGSEVVLCKKLTFNLVPDAKAAE